MVDEFALMSFFVFFLRRWATRFFDDLLLSKPYFLHVLPGNPTTTAVAVNEGFRNERAVCVGGR